MMIFAYEELKECIEEDFERFCKMGFHESQIFPAVLNEYEHGEDFCFAENACIHVFLALNYMGNGLDCSDIVEKINLIMDGDVESKVEAELGNEYMKFVADLNKVRSGK